VVKASDSCAFLRHKFPGQRKVYFADTVGECRQIAETVYKSGYGARILVQECISGAGGAMPHAAVLTTYSDSSGKVICAVRGEVLLEERGYTSRGNYSAIVSSPLTSLDISLIAMLEGVGYTGIANFDLLKAPGGEVCLELNPRQGRSFDYTRSAGVNLANFLVDDMCGRELVPRFIYPEGFWREAGRRTVITHAERGELLERAMELERRGRGISAYDYRRGEGWLHKLYVACHGALEHRRFLRYRKEAGGYAHS
jgi:D-aspartate ligase